MNKAEFAKATGQKYEEINEHDFDIINTVYVWHPMISDVNGKKEIAVLWKQGGMGIMLDMYNTADEIRNHESSIQVNTVAMEKLHKEQKAELEALAERHNRAKCGIRNDIIAANDRIREITEAFNKEN